MDVNECSAPILIECEDCGLKFFDNEEHTPADCLHQQKIGPDIDYESLNIERLNDETYED